MLLIQSSIHFGGNQGLLVAQNTSVLIYTFFSATVVFFYDQRWQFFHRKADLC